MVTNDTIDNDAWVTLAAVARLLRHTAVCAWALVLTYIDIKLNHETT